MQIFHFLLLNSPAILTHKNELWSGVHYLHTTSASMFGKFLVPSLEVVVFRFEGRTSLHWFH